MSERHGSLPIHTGRPVYYGFWMALYLPCMILPPPYPDGHQKELKSRCLRGAQAHPPVSDVSVERVRRGPSEFGHGGGWATAGSGWAATRRQRGTAGPDRLQLLPLLLLALRASLTSVWTLSMP